MRVLYDEQIFRMQQYGGVSRYFFELASYLAQVESVSVEIFAPLYVNRYFHRRSAVRPNGIRIPKVPFAGGISRRINAVLSRVFIKPRTDIDIFHETYYSQADIRPSSGRRVITVFDMIHEKFPDHFPPQDLTREIKADAVSRADHVICISENTRRDLIELSGIPLEKTSVVYLGHALSGVSGAVTPQDCNKPFLLYVGARRGYKNFDAMLRAYSRSRLLRENFSVICFGGGGLLDSERGLIDSLKISPDSVQQIGGDDAILTGLYQAAAAFVYPSLYEGFGIPPLEAMALGCPVVCSNASSLPEVVGDAAELFDPADGDDMQAAMERAVSSSQHAAGLVARGRERVKGFSWERCAQDTLAVYRNVLRN